MIIAWILIPQELGLVALAYSVTAFTNVLQQNGLREILVQRGQSIYLYVNAAFWMSLATGLTVAFLTLAASPLAVRIYNDPSLYGILGVLALSAPLLALKGVPAAQLQSEMRFKALSGFNVFESFALTILTVVFALNGFGPYSVVLPAPIVQLISLMGMFKLTRPKLSWSLDRSYWPELFTQSGLMLGSSLLYAFNMQGANMVLGLFHSAALVGTFFFANNVVSQLTSLVANNLWYVLLPSFSQLQDDLERLGKVFLRVLLMSNVIGMPICFLLAIVARPATHLFYGAKWEGAIPAIQILSLGMLFNISFGLSITLMFSQGRFGYLFRFNIHRAIAFLMLVAAGAWWGGLVEVSVAVAIFFMIYGPLATYCAVRPLAKTWAEVARAHIVPLAVGTVASLPAIFILFSFPGQTRLQLGTAILFACMAYAALYIPLIRLFLPEVWQEIVGRLRGLLQKRVPHIPSA